MIVKTLTFGMVKNNSHSKGLIKTPIKSVSEKSWNQERRGSENVSEHGWRLKDSSDLDCKEAKDFSVLLKRKKMSFDSMTSNKDQQPACFHQ